MSVSRPLILRLYSLATAGFGPFSGLLLGRRQRRGKEDPLRRPERIGIAGKPRPEGPLCWLHGASVGESITLLPIAERLGAQGFQVLMTTGTVTSAALMARRLPAGAIHQFVPLDVPAFVRRFLRHWQPDLAVFLESEIWPTMVQETRAAGVALALVNARMSPRSFARWRRAPRTIGTLLGCFDLIAAQSEDDGERFKALGAPNVMISGNLKFDAPAPSADEAKLGELQTAIGARPLWLAAATHDGEEALAGEVHAGLKDRFVDLLTLIVPRHPDRGPAVAAELRAKGLKVGLRSEGAVPQADMDVYVADTVGEMGLFYRLARIVFVGKSLLGDGGQNPIEPAKLGAAVLHGPFVQNFLVAYGALDGMGGAIMVRSSGELASAVARLLADPAETERVAEGGARAIASLTGALDRTMTALAALAAKPAS
ncbi:3-deoxy-D-manno-octulosonic acid transferase [Labrys miyagiensis]|uniref:3-deoxy-D-manno-octulosonic acid transferase n=1 Tax=Labrys miyagiensis TaxID=346912 RepID=A0ABQ6CQB9_9HYPH|nr:3-deoxy-D-manno-octulosonic acid transferase [Labrys miyagiensis]GLS22546.1 3-deoxy-D-manno-octulosonic acid transferase [Labrys miyagiensis]